ncbi:glycosyltransferase family 4 protein [Thiocapsa roseopersicina]|uniref:Glycosyltransferase involved in cell wall bisynthesis n=1 Tax=Thiocapsa roseopersicina TaxID=1058 RepID=A0A1H2QBY9_THIRO|nr:glycosyltransferase family 1 protein [Thiocapsa roseopersicina]SDW04605.1 Glycosyltransferase involved in cell wall bisynthesis [Thiocapsa roseopersicina]
MSVYADLVARELATFAPEWDVELVQLLGAREDAPGGRMTERFIRVRKILVARRLAEAVKADVYHLLDGSFGYMVAGLPWARTLVTVHDLIPALQAHGRFGVRPPGWAARRLIDSSLRVIARAGSVCAVSRQTADDVLALTKRPVDAVIHSPLKNFPPIEVVGLECRSSDPPFVLHVGNNSFYKNRAGVLKVFAIMLRQRPELRLVMAGPAPDGPLMKVMGEYQLGECVRFVTNPDDTELADLYRRAVLFLFPSVYEGFGWPPLEAMHFGCPVVCSDAGSLPEVTGEAALRCPPDDIAGLAAAGLRILDDPALASRLVKQGRDNLERFGSGQMAHALVTLYQRLAVGKT